MQQGAWRGEVAQQVGYVLSLRRVLMLVVRLILVAAVAAANWTTSRAMTI